MGRGKSRKTFDKEDQVDNQAYASLVRYLVDEESSFSLQVARLMQTEGIPFVYVPTCGPMALFVGDREYHGPHMVSEALLEIWGIEVGLKVPSIMAGAFVRRQTPESQWAHYDGSWEEVVDLVKFNWDRRRHGYRDGVVLVPVPPRGFYTPIIRVDESTRLDAYFGSRRPHEEKHVSVSALGSKKEARRVDVVLYRADVLDEGDERETDADWEIVSVNACPSKDEAPMKPLTMARNFLVKDGGTEGNYTARQFAEAIWFWSQHANVREPDEGDFTCPLCMAKQKTVEASELARGIGCGQYSLEQAKQDNKKEDEDVADS